MTIKFDSKIFNAEAFGKYYNTIPDTSKTELLKSGAMTGSQEIRNLLSTQTNAFYGVIPFYGLLDGDDVNYDGLTDIDKFMRVVAMSEIKENDYNLNISRYIDTSSEEVIIFIFRT